MRRQKVDLLVVAKNLLFHLVCLRRVDRYLALRSRLVLAAARSGVYERADMQRLKTFVRPGSDTIDVGANAGAYTQALARIIGATGRVFAFEPQPLMAALLERACGTLPTVTVIREALSDTTGAPVELRLPLLPGGVPESALATLGAEGDVVRTWTTTVMRSARLDDHFERFRDVSFIKVDIEGHEPAFLLGATRTIRAFAPVVQIEAAGLRASAPRVREWLRDMDYAIFSQRHGRLEQTDAGAANGLNVYLIPRSGVPKLTPDLFTELELLRQGRTSR